ncbi:MAG: FAD-dependent oxidoreductase [Deltaproteobacteria bacterium]|nr:FAD-dependent oxidoreductase [Deltaproteobacteria bacterium]
MTAHEVRDVIVVGAGVAGLAAAHRLKEAGRAPLVLTSGRGIGGRCATWRLDGQPVDYGVGFLHGVDPELVAAIHSVGDATPIPGWPRHVEGRGTPCQPRAFAPQSARLAYAEGVSAFPKWLARDLEVRRQTTVERLALGDAGIVLTLASGEQLCGRDVILAMAGPQAETLLVPLVEDSDEVDAARRLLAMLGALPSLTVMAAYDPGTPEPPFEMLYPEDSALLQTVAHDSSKRKAPRALVLVLQALPRWSRAHLDTPPETWERMLLDEAGRLIAPWVRAPSVTRTHRWKWARVDAGCELSQPLLIPLGAGFRLGVAGELFAPGGGVEAAWLSGHRLAGRMLESRPS